MKISITSIYNWYRDAIRHPKYRWWIVLGTLVYLVSPFDILPDIIPIVGEIDDVMIATLLITEISQMFLDKLKTRKEEVKVDSATTPGQTVEVSAETVSTEKA